MTIRIPVQLTLIATLALVGCQSNPLALEDETIQEARAQHEIDSERQEYEERLRDEEIRRQEAHRRAQQRQRTSRGFDTSD